MNYDQELALAIHAARQAATCLDADFADNAGIESRDGKDIKTKADKAAEAAIITVLKPSGIPVLAEESAAGETIAEGMHWLVDPLDGTMNFVRGFPVFAVSIGLWDGKTPVAGVVLDLAHDILYDGAVNSGCRKNGKPIRVSPITERGQAILATGFPTGRNYSEASLKQFLGQIQDFKKIRMIGAAALSLSMVAEGVFDAYHEEDIMIWDVAAGLALVKAAGGKVEVSAGTGVHKLCVTATNGHFEF